MTSYKKLVTFLCFVDVTTTYLISPVGTYGPSMLPAIDSTPALFLREKISPRFGQVARGDIIVLRNPNDPTRMMTKRVLGLEGDTVTVSDPAYNDKPKTILVPKGHIWVEGDNKNKSNDSRKFGPVPYDLIDGKMFWKILPLNHFGPFWNK